MNLHIPGLGCSRFARRYWGNRGFLSVPQGTEMFHFSWFTLAFIQMQVTGIELPARLPDSGISGLTLISNYPKLIAACHALHRYLAPRHPP